ncbi:hypothetical protein MMC10_008306 [Thelotrema lepadinum]|nr:hypothetical protein [Thelotrema lepadinum]
MDNFQKSISELSPVITEILQISGAAGASIGILHDNQTFFHNFGRRDIASDLPPDENTVYHIASLSKSFTAAGIGILVHENKLQWNQKVRKILPKFRHRDKRVRRESTILDFLSHRTGLATKNALWQQNGHSLLLDRKDVMPTVSYLEVVEPLGEKWIYNNWNYDVGSEIIQTVSGMSYASFISERIISPLGLNNTYLTSNPPEDEWAHGYMPAPDCQSTDVGRPVIADGTVMQGANAVKSTAKDLLKYYTATLDAWKVETGEESDSGPNMHLKNVKEMLTGHIPLEPDSAFEQWYGLGWALATLPAPLGSIGTNGMFVPNMPVVGKGANETPVWYHNGSLVGFFSSVHILPMTGTIIVVLVNSIPKNDCADWLGQLLLETILDNSYKNDYVSLARKSAASYDQMWVDLDNHFKDSSPTGPHPRSLKKYVGKYYNKPGNWYIKVWEVNGSLSFAFQGRSTQSSQLRSYGKDTFTWKLTEEESRRKGRWPDLDILTYVFKFGGPKASKIQTLCWVHDPDVPKGELFVKRRLRKFRNGGLVCVKLSKLKTRGGSLLLYPRSCGVGGVKASMYV